MAYQGFATGPILSVRKMNTPQPISPAGRADRQSRFPRDLADIVHSELARRTTNYPNLDVLAELFEAMYFASMKTEESEPVAFHVVYLDPANPDPSPPGRIVHNRWSCVPLKESVLLSGRNFLKIAAASDPRTSSFAVHQDSDGRLAVWGLIDQGNSYHDYVNFDSETGPERPGLFQASITGIAHLVVYLQYEKIAELKQNHLLRSAIDVLQRGAVRDALQPGISSHLVAVQKRLPEFFSGEPMDWQPPLIEDWTSALRRLLLRVQNIRHGGAFLLANDRLLRGLSAKHEIKYDRLRSAMERHAVAKAEQFIAGDEINEEFLEKDAEELPLSLHVDESVASFDLEEIRSELDAAIWFISLLTRVDGVVLMTQELEVQGFGVEITSSEEPEAVFVATDAEGTPARLQKVDYQLYGTRHRSMMRYCAMFPGSVGFVVSQDGDVRVITMVGDRLVMWDNIRLQLPKFVRRKNKSKRKRRRRKFFASERLAGGPGPSS
jgi:hypothetical protein